MTYKHIPLIAAVLTITCGTVRGQGIVEAVESGNYARVKYFLDQDCSLARTDPDDVLDVHFGNLINLAASLNEASIVRLLLNCGVSPDTRSSTGSAPLILAATNGDSATVKLLLDHGATVDITNRNGDTPLHGAAGLGHPLIVKMLLIAGASREERDNDGLTPLDFAKEADNTDAVLVLMHYVRSKSPREISDSITETGMSYMSDDNVSEARSEFELALRYAMTSKDLWGLGITNEYLGDTGKALQYFTKSSEIYSSDNDFNPSLSKGLLLIGLHRYDEARQYFNSPGCYIGYTLLGDMEFKRSHFKEAVDRYKVALEDGTFPPALMGLAVALDSLNQDSVALSVYENGLYNTPKSSDQSLDNPSGRTLFDPSASEELDEDANLKCKLATSFLGSIDSLDSVGEIRWASARLFFCDTACPNLHAFARHKQLDRGLRLVGDSMNANPQPYESAFIKANLTSLKKTYTEQDSLQRAGTKKMLVTYYQTLGMEFYKLNELQDATEAFNAALDWDPMNQNLLDLRSSATARKSPLLAGLLTVLVPPLSGVYVDNWYPCIFGTVALGCYGYAAFHPSDSSWAYWSFGGLLDLIAIDAVLHAVDKYNASLFGSKDDFQQFDLSFDWRRRVPIVSFATRF